jgi:putative ABC transport system permease protein
VTRAPYAPPRIPLALLERALDPALRDALIGDAIERFDRDCSECGVLRARRRFWRETFVAIRHFGALSRLVRPDNNENRMSGFITDLRIGVRMLCRAPAFALICIATLALAIGPTTAILSIVEPLLIQPLPFPKSDRLAVIWERDRDGRPLTIGYATMNDIRTNATQLQSVTALATWETTISSPTAPEKVEGLRVTWNYFSTLGVQPALGRDFVRDEDATGRTNVVLLSHGLWTRRFGADSSLIGRPIQLGGVTNTVIGVLPASYDDMLAPGVEIFRPLGYQLGQPWACRGCRHLHVIARIRPGVPQERALAELNQVSANMVAANPKEYPSVGMYLTPMKEQVTRDARPALLAILGAAVLVLLIAVANIVNLQIARGVRRESEFTVRVALGASVGRLAQQLIAEGLVIAAIGGVLGVVLGKLTLPLLVARLPQTLARLSAIHLDLNVLAAIAIVLALLAVVIGLIPARGIRRRVVFSGALRGATRVSSRGHARMRVALVIGEVALALVLLTSAGLLAKSLRRLFAVDVGFDPSNLATMIIESSGARYATDAAALDFRRRAVEAVREVPGVISAGASTTIPLSGAIDRFGIVAEGKPLANPALAPPATGYRVSGDYIKTLKIRLLAGRDFDVGDMRDSAESVVVVSKSLAAALWGSGSPIGKRIEVPNARAKYSRVIGVATDVRHASLDSDDSRAFYILESAWSWANSDAVLVARTRDGSKATVDAVRKAVAAIDPSQPITNVRSMDAVVASSAAQRQIALTLFAAFAMLAVVLASAGIYGVLSGSVAERTREIGLRSALGASPADLLRLVLGRGAMLAGFGVVIGVSGSFVVTRYLRSLLFGIAPTDVSVFLAASVVLFAIAIVACLVPARRAVRIDPMVALRE